MRRDGKQTQNQSADALDEPRARRRDAVITAVRRQDTSAERNALLVRLRLARLP